MKAKLGETVTLAVTIKSKDPVTFDIKLGDDVLTTVAGTTKNATATAPWTVDLKGNAPPATVTFTARAGGKALSSGTLDVEPAVPVVGPLGPTGKNQGVIALANGVLQIDVGSKVEMVGTVRTAEPADVEVFVDDVPAQASQPGKPLGGAVFRTSGVSGGNRDATFTVAWDVQPVGTPLVRLRADIKVDGQVVEQRRSNLILLADWVDVTLRDPAAVDAKVQGKEGRERHVFLSGQPVPEVVESDTAAPPPPVTAERRAAWLHNELRVELDGAVPEQNAVLPDEHGAARVRFAHGTKAKQIAVRAQQTFYAAAWHDAAATTPGEAGHKIVQPRTQIQLAVTARRRLSLWLAPNNLFGWPNQVGGPGGQPGGTWPDQDHWNKLRDHVDDVVLLNLFRPFLAADPAAIEIRYVGIPRVADTIAKNPGDPAAKATAAQAAKDRVARTADLRRIISACHANGTQVLLGHGGIIGNLSESPWLSFLNTTKDLTDNQITAQAKQVIHQIIDVDGFEVDGLDFDLEHLTRKGGWPMRLRQRVRSFFRALAVELQQRNKLLGIASASFVSHAQVAPNTPATGSGTGQTFTLAIECPNILMRPMCYDNAFLDDQLLAFQRDVVAFALADAPAGAGVHPAQFQVGVKTFRGTNNSPDPMVPGDDAGNQHRLKGYYRRMPSDLITLCKDTLSPSRVGVICFGPPFQSLAEIDAALNPTPGDKKQVKTIGTPLQAPLLP